MPWDDLKVLEAIERLGGIGRAARELGVSVSTVYRRVAALEEEFGAPCLDRTTGAGSLTEIGSSFAAVARSTATSLSELARRHRSKQEEPAGQVRLTTVEGFAPLLEGPVERLLDRHPRLRIDLVLANDGPSVRKRAADVAITVARRPVASLWGRRLFTITYGVFGTARALERRPSRWVVFGPPMQATPQAAWERDHVTDDRAAVATGSRLAFLGLVRRGIGVGLLPRCLAALYPELLEAAGHCDLDGLDRLAWGVTHPDLRKVAGIKAVMDELVDTFAEASPPLRASPRGAGAAPLRRR
jgi:molybdate transport repressor ModE-like protein